MSDHFRDPCVANKSAYKRGLKEENKNNAVIDRFPYLAEMSNVALGIAWYKKIRTLEDPPCEGLLRSKQQKTKR